MVPLILASMMINTLLNPLDFKPRNQRGFKTRGFKTDAEKISHEIRECLQIATHGRLRAKQLACSFGVRLKAPADLGWSNLEEFESHFSLVKKFWSAFLIDQPGHSRLIISNPTSTPFRRESDLFHEIAHIICGHKPGPINLLGDLALRSFNEEDEKEAEFLGYALHLPKDALFRAARQGLDDEAVSHLYQASRELVRFRFNATQARKIVGPRR